MCEPVSAAMAVVGVAQAAVSGAGARKAAKRQAAYQYKLGNWQNKRYQLAVDYQKELGEWQTETYNKIAASEQKSLTGQYASVLEQLDQRRTAALEMARQYSEVSEQSQSRLRTAAVENTTTGNSVRLAQQVYAQTEARSIDVTYRNLDAQFRQANRDMLAMQAASQSRVNQAMPAPMRPVDPVQPLQGVAQPSMLPFILQGASSVIGAAAHAQNVGAFDPKPTTGSTAFPATSAAHLGPLGSPQHSFSAVPPPSEVYGTNTVLAAPYNPASLMGGFYRQRGFFNPYPFN